MSVSFVNLPTPLIYKMLELGSFSKSDYANLLLINKTYRDILKSSAFIKSVVSDLPPNMARQWQNVTSLQELSQAIDAVETKTKTYPVGAQFLETIAHLGYLNPKRVEKMLGFMNLENLQKIHNGHRTFSLPHPSK